MSNPEDNQPQYKVGDVVNGHVLTPANTWEPIADPMTAPGAGSPAVAGVTPPADEKPKRKWYLRKRVLIPAGILALLIMISAINGGSKADDVASTKAPAAAADAPAAEEEPSDAPEVEKITVPDVTGVSAAAAIETLRAAGFEVADVDDPENATVTGTTPAQGGIAEKGSTVTVTVEVKPTLTLEQLNAVGTAKSYLDTMPFSRQGLIDQMASEYGSGYPVDVSTWAVDYLNPDWNAEAAEAAQSYLDSMSFSRDGLFDQLTSEFGSQFTAEQANAGLAAVGY